jgi:serine protease Do
MFHLVPLALLMVALADPPAPAPPTPADLVAALETALADAIAKAEPSVVAIARTKSPNGDETTAVRGHNPPEPEDNGRVDQLRLNPALVLQQELEQTDRDFRSFDYGSGVVIGDAGQILTAYHVIKGASRIFVRAAGRQFFDAEVIAADPRSDLAVLVPRVKAGTPAPTLKPIALGDASKLRKGSFLLALGNPFNAADDGTASASWGILANVARRLDASPEDQSRRIRQLRHFSTLLQLDAKLNLGMSGGAVVNLKGELVGLTTAASSAAGFDVQAGYAIPIDPLGRRVIDALKQGKEVEYGFIGIHLDEVVHNRVGAVEPDSPAHQGGLLQGDTIIAVGDAPVTDGDNLILAVNAAPVGQPVTLRLLRKGEIHEKTVVLSKMPVLGGEVIATNRTTPWRGLRVDFTSTLAFGTFSDDILKAMAKGSVAVVEVLPGSPAEAAGLRRGQVITAVVTTPTEKKPVHRPADFAHAVAGRKGAVTLITELGPVTVK